MSAHPSHVLLRNGGTAALLAVPRDSLPSLLYWGADLGPLSPEEQADLVAAQVPAVVSGGADVPPTLSLVPQQSEGWVGTPGLVGSRDGLQQFPAFTAVEQTHGVEERAEGWPSEIQVVATDAGTGVTLALELGLTASGLLRTRATLTNTGQGDYGVESLLLALPVPAEETLVIDQTGHHLRERDTAFHEFSIGSHERTTRIARGHAASTIHGTCAPGTGWRSGSTHYVHVGWSGNTRTIAERDISGFQCLLAGELLMPGEISLATGESYSTPWVCATWGRGLDEAASRFHAYLRARAGHPRTPRPVTLNAWEAVYFDHSLPRLLDLVETAAEVGVERFVLDDGWFSSRRDDTSGLGDWVVSAEVWPDGLTPLADAVHERGMQFGLWFEPEMINPDSEAARAHPDWILSPATHRPLPARSQQVIDLTNPQAFSHVLTQMLSVLDSVEVDYIKWDFNRDLYEAVSPLTGLPAYHAQTLATYALMDAVLAAHPGLEIESCAGGGGRIDLGILERAVRVWGSDCIDPLERQQIEAGTSLLLPPEMVGSHVASHTSHTTGRTLGLTLRATTALFSHMGIEWDLATATTEELTQLRSWVSLHKQLRGLLHSGEVVHCDHPDRGWWVHGVVSTTGDAAVFALTRMRTSPVRPSPPLRLPGLLPDVSYRVAPLLAQGLACAAPSTGHGSVPWWNDGLVLTGRVLEEVGIRFPDLPPEEAVLLSVRRI